MDPIQRAIARDVQLTAGRAGRRPWLAVRVTLSPPPPPLHWHFWPRPMRHRHPKVAR